MKVDRRLTKNLANTADIINTVNGGTVYPLFNTNKEEDHYRLEVSVPSVDPRDIKVEVSDGDLLVYQSVRSGAMSLPNLLGIIRISRDVVLDDISAEYEDELLTVIMPINELPGGLHREIKVRRPN